MWKEEYSELLFTWYITAGYKTLHSNNIGYSYPASQCLCSSSANWCEPCVHFTLKSLHHTLTPQASLSQQDPTLEASTVVSSSADKDTQLG